MPNNLCIECGQRERFKSDLLCEVCRKQAYDIQDTGKTPCRCNCGYTCNRKCGLSLDDCLKEHYKKDCDHQWDGPRHEFADGCGFSVTCSKCGVCAMDHDCAVGP